MFTKTTTWRLDRLPKWDQQEDRKKERKKKTQKSQTQIPGQADVS